MKLKEELPMIKDIAEYRLLIEKYIEDIQNMNVEDYPLYFVKYCYKLMQHLIWIMSAISTSNDWQQIQNYWDSFLKIVYKYYKKIAKKAQVKTKVAYVIVDYNLLPSQFWKSVNYPNMLAIKAQSGENIPDLGEFIP